MTHQRKSTDPAPQLPMLTDAALAAANARRARNPVVPHPDAPKIDDTVIAALIMTGLMAQWNINHWRVFLPDASSITNHVGGGKLRRWQTGVRADASPEEWMAEINRFVKDARPNESLPFGKG